MLGQITQMELLIYGSFRGAISSFLFPSHLLLLAYYLFKRHYVVRKRVTLPGDGVPETTAETFSLPGKRENKEAIIFQLIPRTIPNDENMQTYYLIEVN